jgi:hypothetical protein
VFGFRANGDGGFEVAALLQRLDQQPGHVGPAANRRRHAVSIDDRPAQGVAVDSRRGSADDADSRDRMDRTDVVAERHAFALERCVDPDVLEPAKAEQMGDRFADCGHQ